jgi:putative addiction module component (TIGR02574 family)
LNNVFLKHNLINNALYFFEIGKALRGKIMKKRISVSDVAGFSVAERIQFVEDVWDSIAVLPDQVELPEETKKELDKRLESYHRNPDSGSPWEEVKKRIQARK